MEIFDTLTLLYANIRKEILDRTIMKDTIIRTDRYHDGRCYYSNDNSK